MFRTEKSIISMPFFSYPYKIRIYFYQRCTYWFFKSSFMGYYQSPYTPFFRVKKWLFFRIDTKEKETRGDRGTFKFHDLTAWCLVF